MNDEQAIASKLASEMKARREAEVAPTVTTPAPEVPKGEEGYVFDKPFDEFDYQRIYDFFRIPSHEQKDPQTTKMMDTVVEWAYRRGAKEYFDVVASIRSIQDTIKYTDLYHIYEFANLQMKSMAIDKEMRALYG